ncbi:MAG: carbamoyltransferase N-terminal domain-containing protein [Cytophagales bacterium]|nr:carbamoyltransferase N-terminal domain-containing protein [Cytophagales bacterium]
MNDKIICGLKLTHDGGIAVIKGNQLIFSIEMEKLNNNPRFSSIPDLSIVKHILAEYDLEIEDVDHFVIDGWSGLEDSFIEARSNGNPVKLAVAGYREKALSANVFQPFDHDSLPIDNHVLAYSSYMHVTGHIAGAYCSSPFARANQSSYILVWDGGMFPRLYYFDAQKIAFQNLGPINFLIGNFYQVFASYFHPFSVANPQQKEDLSIAGKVMAYIAKGEVVPDLLDEYNSVLKEHLDLSLDFVHTFVKHLHNRRIKEKYREEDMLATMHQFLQDQLLEGLKNKLSKYPANERNLCYAGGCALNIKWNSALRNSGLLKELWIPPFPNDSGSAIGVACAKMITVSPDRWLDWRVFCGPKVQDSLEMDQEWSSMDCPIETLAGMIAENEDLPVVVLQGNAEVGPRSLGGRSIIASARSTSMKDILNRVKDREPYRPVAPICLEEDAPEVFNPGSPDPYMLFDHMVKESWLQKIPAVCHLDGSARLQTVNKAENPVIYRLLAEYKRHTGIPVLCNTSANFKGKGFFPDVKSVMEWGEVDLIWSDDKLHYHKHAKSLVKQYDTLTAT